MKKKWLCVSVDESSGDHKFEAGKVYEETSTRSLYDGHYYWHRCECESGAEWLQANFPGLRFHEIPSNEWSIDEFKSGDIIVYDEGQKEMVMRDAGNGWDVRLTIDRNNGGFTGTYGKLSAIDFDEMTSPAFGKISKIYRPLYEGKIGKFSALNATHNVVWEKGLKLTMQEAATLLQFHFGSPVAIDQMEVYEF